MKYYKPVNLYRGAQKVAGWIWAERPGSAVEFEDTYNDAVHGVINGHSEQNGTPSPSTPIPIHSAGGCDLKSESADGSKSSSIAMPTLRSLPNGAKDTLTYKGGGMWEHVQRVGVKVFDGTETWTKYNDAEHNVYLSNGQFNAENGVKYASRCSHYPWSPGNLLNNQDEHRFQSTTPPSNRIYISSSDIGSVADFKTFLAAQYAAGTPVTVQYQLATPVTTMLNLGELKTCPHETQIHQDTTGLLADLNLTARVVDKEAE